jgi:hypothetical protein
MRHLYRVPILVASVAFWLSLALSASAAEENSPKSLVFAVQCAGGLSFELTSFNNSSRIGLVSGTTTVVNVVSGSATVSVNSEYLYTQAFPARPGLGIDTLTCDAQASFVKPNGDVVAISFDDAELQFSPR